MIKMMFKYELKKIFSKRVNQVLLAAVLVVTIIYSGMAIGSMRYVDEEGQNHTGIESGRLLAENINQWKGELTAEKISEVINDYKTISAKYPDEIPNTEYGKTVQSYYDIYSFVIGIMTPDSEWNESVVYQLSDEQLQNIYPGMGRVQTDLDLDFKPSDVYLFSKVLWMTLKGDNIGFRGQYQRGEVQIYLNKEDYDNVITLEPIHKLMEEATFEEMGKRISIQKCIEYLELQRKILNREEYELLSNEFVSQLLYDEYSKKIIACSKPDELTYKDAAIITHMLRDIIPISNIFVKSLHSDQNIKQIQITDFQVGMDGICKLLYYNKGIKIKEYLLNISKMNYSNYSSVISLELNDISLVDEGYIAYSAAGHGFGNEYPRVYFSSGEKIIIKRKENL